MSLPDTLLLVLPWALLLAGVAALLWVLYRRPPQVRLSREVPRAGFSGGEVPLTVRAELRSALPVRYLIEDPTPRSVVPRAAVAFSGEVLGRQKREHQTSVMLGRRGEYVWPGATLHWADPLGLCWRRTPLAGETRLDVFPGTHGLLLPDLLRPLLSEGSLSRSLGLDDPISLRGARSYLPGDPPGRVHWRLSARSGELTVRELERTAASSLTVYLDTSAGGEVYLESAVRLASSLVQEAQALGLPVSVATRAQATPTGRTPEAGRAALLALARAQLDPAPPSIPEVRPGGNLIILTAGGSDALVRGALRARAAASRVSLVALPEGFYLEPGEKPRRQWAAPPDSVRALERQAGALAEAGILVSVLRGNHSVLRLGG
ncbi:Uncharacterized conserved protein, DUF58 family, contains vWF domain [Deinococcus reticulitermitis]|uniref:Uncharacterized conserved protein, DUF58 family, contains vWF domain n=1 Tax=Deinococcus reticulitermitis TaxID=856736 RepID=A0A1H6XRI0_9DEIO|nr:DUF58 domain-containing protein [Deinococcus reticulitermitis]SEJ27470.1 Uncharacterized conserved protein, DUF58 family, contains vWF domain [Deinococcus reticulitermitis]